MSDVDTGPAADAELVAALLAGDEERFASLVGAWSPAMLRLARAHVATVESAEDVVQEAWLAALRGLERFEGRSRLRTWVFQIVLNLARTRGVQDHRSVPFSAIDPDGGPTVDPARFQGPGERFPGGWRVFPAAWPSPESAVIGGEARRVIGHAISRLPARQRAVMELRDVHGFAPEEVCEMLELTSGNQRVLLHRARAFVRQQLEDYFAGRAAVRTERA